MTDSARVTSLEALARFRAAFGEFGEVSRLALSNAESDIQRTIAWVQTDRRAHWQRQFKLREKKLAEAKTQLHAAELQSSDTRPSLVVERKAVQKAVNALEEARHKLDRIAHWNRAFDRDLMLYKGQTTALSGKLDRDIPKGMARLAQLMDHLDKYIRLSAPSQGGSGGSKSTDDDDSSVASSTDGTDT